MDEQVVTSTPSMADYYGMIKAEHEANNAWSAEQAQKAMDYQTQMSNSAHTREVADLKAAGLNPILSAGGQGATTGSGMAAQRSDTNVEALYGLTKMAIESNMEQAKAMQNTAKYASGGAGSANPTVVVSSSLPVYDEKKKGIANRKEQTAEKVLKDAGYGNFYDILDSAEKAVSDRLYRKFGIKQETSMSLMKKGEQDLLNNAKGAKDRADALVKGVLGFNNANASKKANDKAEAFLLGALGFNTANSKNNKASGAIKKAVSNYTNSAKKASSKSR